MMLAGVIEFSWTPWTLALTLLAMLAAAVAAVVACRRSGYRRSVLWLEILRTGIVALCATLFNQPEWVEVRRVEERQSIVVLCDASRSMSTRDVVVGESPEALRTTRREAGASIADPAFWSRLTERMEVVIQSFPAESEAGASNLHEPLVRATAQKNLRGVVLLSDGDWNAGPPPVEAADRLRMKGIPVFAIPIGSRDRLPDIEVVSLDAPSFGVADKAVRVPFALESSLPREAATTVLLRVSDGSEVAQEIRIAPMGRTSESIVWKPGEVGEYSLTLEVPLHPDEVIVDNNRATAPISIREERLRVLVVESTPRWEYRYLRNALSRDPGVAVSCLLFHPGLSKVGGGSSDYVTEFPAGLDELSVFDVVFLGDVGVEEGQLTREQCRLLKGLVEYQASGLVFLPGFQGCQITLRDTELDDLYPVVLDPAQPSGWGSRMSSQIELTEAGRRSLLTKLADTAAESAEVWDGLPGFQWYAPVVRVRAGCEVLAVHKDVANEFGRLPLLVTRTFGAGKVLFMGTDGAWRWRKGVEDKYHYRFWGQVVRWMAYARNMAKGETMRFYYAPDQPQVRKSVTLRANVMAHSGEPLADGEVTARITAPSGRAETIRFAPAGDEWGAYAGSFVAQEPGAHEVALFCRQTQAALATSFFVQGDVLEPIGRAARPEVLEEIARVTGGEVVEIADVARVLQCVEQLPEPPLLERRIALWCNPVVAGLLLLLLALFWVGRKAAGLI